MEYDIEAYLEGKLSGAALQRFEEELRSNPDFRSEVKQRKQMMRHLNQQWLREQVDEALKEQGPPSNRAFRGPLFAILLLVGLTALFYWSDPKTENQPSTPPTEESSVPPSEPSNAPAPPTEDPESKSNSNNKEEKSTPAPPIAQGDPIKSLPAPDFPAPQVRGSQANQEEWKAFLDAIWYTQFPPPQTSFNPPFEEAASLITERRFPQAYIRLQQLERKISPNDSLNFLKAYCLLEMGEGAEANRYWAQQQQAPKNWEASIEWYRGLSFLLSGDRSQAVLIFEKIAGDAAHPYAQASQKALKRLQ